MRAAIASVIWLGCGSHAATSQPDVALCDGQTIPLIATPGRLHVAVNDGAALLLVDTGSSTTFLQEPLGSPDPVPNAGVIALGCRMLAVDGRPEVADSPVDGVPSIGTLGTDVLRGGPSELDLADAELVLHPDGMPFPEAAGWPTVPFDVTDGLVLPHVALDGSPVRLMLDTGSADTLWLGQQPEPGDVEVDTTDAEGNVVKLYQGTAVLTIGAWQGTVPVLRAPSFPYFEQTVAALGGNIAGLLGLSSLGNGAVIDIDSEKLSTDQP